jgi:hypothetical protein
MKWYNLLLGGILAITACSAPLQQSCPGGVDMILAIRWQRLVDQHGDTCDRCGGTQAELNNAISSLRQSLSPLGIRVSLEEKALSPQECADDIMESNRIWIAERPLEDWLGAEVGATVCGSCCAKIGETVECRTTTVEGRTYEVIPSQLIVRAGLQAASQMITAPGARPCCPAEGSSGSEGGRCCP